MVHWKPKNANAGLDINTAHPGLAEHRLRAGEFGAPYRMGNSMTRKYVRDPRIDASLSARAAIVSRHYPGSEHEAVLRSEVALNKVRRIIDDRLVAAHRRDLAEELLAGLREIGEAGAS